MSLEADGKQSEKEKDVSVEADGMELEKEKVLS